MENEKDPQLERLNAQLQQKGITPERDLWPGINGAISAEEKRLFEQPKKKSEGFWRPQMLWVAAAMAAFALILIPLGLQTNDPGQMAKINQEQMGEELALDNSESALFGALKDLEIAVRENPGDQNLSRLIRMVSSRQGDYLRYKWDENSRVQEMLNGGVS